MHRSDEHVCVAPVVLSLRQAHRRSLAHIRCLKPHVHSEVQSLPNPHTGIVPAPRRSVGIRKRSHTMTTVINYAPLFPTPRLGLAAPSALVVARGAPPTGGGV